MNRIISTTFGLWLATVGAATAQSTPVVVELYTSQGCSSCPPADEFMARLAPRDDVIALALHVDYWDYIGWKDRFARPQHTERQKRYAHAIGSRTIYTPQMIIGGKDRVEGFRPMDVADLIEAHHKASTPITLKLERSGGQLHIAISAAPPLERSVAVQIVRYRPEETIKIERGENAGRTMTYHNIVTDWHALGKWDGQKALSLDVPAEGEEPVVVIVQELGEGPILAAARLR